MGNRLSNEKICLKELKKPNDKKVKQSKSAPTILCLHGWRTSGEILSMQMGALRHNTGIDCTFVDAPFASIGDPDPGISFFYKNFSYYEWFLKDYEINDIENKTKILKENDTINYNLSKKNMKILKKNMTEKDCIDFSLDLLIQYINESMKSNIIFDGILGNIT